MRNIKSLGPKFANYNKRRGRRKGWFHPSMLDIGERADVKSYRAKAKRKLRAGNRVRLV